MLIVVMQTVFTQKIAYFHRFNFAFPIFSSYFATNEINPGRFIKEHPIFRLLDQAHCITDLRFLHSHFITSGHILDSFAASRLVQFFLRSSIGGLSHAFTIFSSLSHPDVFTWNSIIAGITELGSSLDSVIGLYFRMRASHSPPNLYTFALLVKACHKYACCENSVKQAKKVHGQVLKGGAEDFIIVKNSLLTMYCCMKLLDDALSMFVHSHVLDLISWNILVSAYGKNGDVITARSLFDKMPERNLVSWSAMIDGCVRGGDWAEALRLFNGLQAKGFRPDVVTLVSVLKACAHSGALDQGRWINLYINRNMPDNNSNVILSTALVDMYCRCGCIVEAFDVFNHVLTKDVVLWNTMIGGLAMYGHGSHAVELFSVMKSVGMTPNEATFIGVMRACTHSGMVDEGIEIFKSMKAHGVEPQREHYGCLVDIMGRAGRVQKAEETLLGMPMKPQAAQWGALMSACRMHNEFDMGVRIGRHLIELEPHDAGRYVMLANMYVDCGRWQEAMNVRREMEDKGLKKETGYSLIEWNGKVQEFVAGDSRHKQIQEIYAMIWETERSLEAVGYVKDTSQVLFDINDDEEKGGAVSYHSEKLAIAFGILNVGFGMPIRIVKNLRVCKDCHNYTKLVSKIYQREIIVRDRNRFHHFKEGVCSCKDYW